MTEEKYLKKLTKYIHDPEIRKEIQDEYRAHIHDCKQALICGGMTGKWPYGLSVVLCLLAD